MGWMSRQKTEWQGPEGAISSTMAAWRPRTSSVLQRSILGLVLSSRWQLTTKLTSSLGGVADTSEGLASTSTGAFTGLPDKWADRNSRSSKSPPLNLGEQPQAPICAGDI